MNFAKMNAVFVLLVVVFSTRASAQDGAEYLASAIRDLKSMNTFQAGRKTDLSYSELKLRQASPSRALRRENEEPLTQSSIQVASHAEAPPLSLTKGELAAIYENAISKGNTVKLDAGTGEYIHAAVHEIDSSPHHDDLHGEETGENGYYYYYYPLKSFIDESPGDHHFEHSYHDNGPHHTAVQPQYHSHTHQHNVHITPLKTEMKKKALEPLFMAISGFIGMAVMFVLSAVVLPRFGVLKSRGGQQFSPQLSSLARVALMAIEGKGCTERMVCEIGKTANAFNLYDNRFVKLVRRVSPMFVRRQIDRVGKYTDKRSRCTAILCKRKQPPAKQKEAKIKK